MRKVKSMKLDGTMAAVISGGASGLGEATARRLASRGMRVAILDRDAARGISVASSLGGLFCEADVTDFKAVAAAIADAGKALGPIRLTACCAGIVKPQKTITFNKATGAYASHDPAQFAQHIAVNLVGTFNLATLAAAHMAALDPVSAHGMRGVIVCTSSVAAEDGQIGQIAYAASKAGVNGMILPMARDLARSGIRVAAIMPGVFATPMMESLPPDAQRALAANVPFPPRLGEPDEFAGLVEHIAENDMLNGCCIRLDGALRMPPK
jgi:NAD(P)-dependent dehydrogenase (short-subunit alcohol dehydrogenase family)